jgi:hypothetical protein
MANDKEKTLPVPVTRQDIMDEIGKLRDSVDRWRVPLQEKQHSHHLALFGNGKPGLDEEVRNIKAMLDTLIRLAWIVVSSVIAIGVGGAIAAAVYLIKVMP